MKRHPHANLLESCCTVALQDCHQRKRLGPTVTSFSMLFSSNVRFMLCPHTTERATSYKPFIIICKARLPVFPLHATQQQCACLVEEGNNLCVAQCIIIYGEVAQGAIETPMRAQVGGSAQRDLAIQFHGTAPICAPEWSPIFTCMHAHMDGVAYSSLHVDGRGFAECCGCKVKCLPSENHVANKAHVPLHVTRTLLPVTDDRS